ncbi:hypothetical protein P355_0950 [Burkholderia cenocepacia KC-01]|nr:hypothetical protein P355_0950 [Burkholderia cenocepacia KC-01]
MPRHHCGLQKNVPDAHYIRCARGCAKRSVLLDSPASTEGKPPPRSLRSLPPAGAVGTLGAARRVPTKKTPRCLPGCL